MSKNEIKEIMEAFEETVNEIWQQDDVSYSCGVSRKTNIKKFLRKLEIINIKNNGKPTN